MFQHRATQFDPRVSAIAGHLRAIEKVLGGIGRSSSGYASASASAAGNQIAEAIWPILNDIVDRFGRGQRDLAIKPVLGLEVVIYCGLIDASLGRKATYASGVIAAFGE